MDAPKAPRSGVEEEKVGAKDSETGGPMPGRRRKFGLQGSLDKYQWRKNRIVKCQRAGWGEEYMQFKDDAVLGRVAPKTLWNEERKAGRREFLCEDCVCGGFDWKSWKACHPER